MKRESIAYWVFNGLFAAFMGLGAIPDRIMIPEAVELFDLLGYPTYCYRFSVSPSCSGQRLCYCPLQPRSKSGHMPG